MDKDWQHIARTDPYLAGSIAARGWEWWDEMSAEVWAVLCSARATRTRWHAVCGRFYRN
jgi:hypothetical protein